MAFLKDLCWQIDTFFTVSRRTSFAALNECCLDVEYTFKGISLF